MKKILILGAGIYQVPVIESAKRKGFEVIVTSIKGNYPGFEIADKVYYENTTDEEAMLSIARKEGIDAVCTAGTDVAMKSLGKIVDELGLPGPGYEATVASSDKLVMKKRFEQNGVLSARYREVTTLDEAFDAFETLNSPVVFKVLDSSGSRGVVKVESKNEIETTYQAIKKYTRLPNIIVEEFIEGEEFGAQAFIFEGELLFTMPHGDMLYVDSTTVPVGHYVPFETTLPDLDSQLLKAIRALGMDNCAINADLILRDGEIFFLELAARAGATCLPELVSTYYGFNYYDLIVDAAAGNLTIPGFNGNQSCGAEVLISEKSGEILSVQADLEKIDDLIEFKMDYKPGDTIRKFKVGPDRIGQLVVKGNDLEHVFNNLARAKDSIDIKLA